MKQLNPLVTQQWSTNNVGIGTITPNASYKLDVSGNGHYSGNLTVDGSINGVLTASMNAANVSAGTFGANTGNGNYSFNGSVGIGTATPSVKLHVSDGTGGQILV